MSGIGHNSKELDRVAKEARKGLKKVHENEEGVIEGWLIYGAALNEGREMFPGDKEFGQWVVHEQLDQADHPDRQAAMWAAANLEEFEAIKEANPRVRTVRGLHAKWKEAQKANQKDNTDSGVVDPDKGGNDSKPVSGNSPSGKGGNTGSNKPSGGSSGDKDKPKKPKPVNNPDYCIAEGMGAIKGIAELYSREYGGTPEDAADVLFSQTVKGCEQDSIGMSIARDRVKWFLKLKEVMDLVEPKMHDFLNQESKLQVVK